MPVASCRLANNFEVLIKISNIGKAIKLTKKNKINTVIPSQLTDFPLILIYKLCLLIQDPLRYTYCNMVTL